MAPAIPVADVQSMTMQKWNPRLPMATVRFRRRRIHPRSAWAARHFSRCSRARPSTSDSLRVRARARHLHAGGASNRLAVRRSAGAVGEVHLSKRRGVASPSLGRSRAAPNGSPPAVGNQRSMDQSPRAAQRIHPWPSGAALVRSVPIAIRRFHSQIRLVDDHGMRWQLRLVLESEVPCPYPYPLPLP